MSAKSLYHKSGISYSLTQRQEVMQRAIGVILEFCLEFTDGEPGVMWIGQAEKKEPSFIQSKLEMPLTYSNGHIW